MTNGIPGFFKGCWPRVIYQMPATAISWACYESFKHFLIRDPGHDDGSSGGESPAAEVSRNNSDSNKAIINYASSSLPDGVGRNSSSSSSPSSSSPLSPPQLLPTALLPTPGPYSSHSSEPTTRTTAKSGLPLPGWGPLLSDSSCV